MTSTAKKILVVGPSWVGDMVMAQSLLILLTQRHPEADIDVLAPGWSRPLMARMPQVREAIELPFQHGDFKPLARLALGKQLRRKHYHQAIVLPYTWKSALVPFGARIRQRTGYTGEQRYGLLNDLRRLDKNKLPMMVQRYCALGLAPGEPLPAALPPPRLHFTAQTQQQARERLGLVDHTAPVAAFCPGAEYGPSKRWPAESFSRVGQALIAKGWQIWLLGSAKDSTAAGQIAAACGAGCVDLTGKTSLEDAIDLLSLSNVVLTNDSGLMHIAAAVGAEVYALYTSSDPRYTPPLTARAHILSAQVECSPCFKKTCRYGHYRCLHELTPARVIAALAAAGE